MDENNNKFCHENKEEFIEIGNVNKKKLEAINLPNDHQLG